MKSDLAHIIASSAFCIIVILFRCGYRILSKCKIHTTCHRTAHWDDAILAFAIIPLLARAICTGMVLTLRRDGASKNELVLASKVLLVSRLGYAMFLWCLKFGILSFYARMMTGSTYLIRSSRVMWWVLVATFVAIVMATLLECRPLPLAWSVTSHDSCQKGMGNLLTMAIANVVTDIALIMLPIPALRQMTLSKVQRLQLSVVFGAGSLVIAITVARLPLIIDQSVSQSVRSLWASIEIAVACLVANVAFIYALIKDVTRGHANSRASLSARGQASFAFPRDSDTLSKLDSAKLKFSSSVEKIEHFSQGRMSWDSVQHVEDSNVNADHRHDGGWRPIV